MSASSSVYIGEETAAPLSELTEVVVMEDDNALRQYVVDALQRIGLKARTVSDAKEAVDIAKRKLCFYYILDVNMGRRKGEEGLDALEGIKKHNPDSFVAVYTGHKGKLNRAMQLGADVFKEKSQSQIKDMTSIVLQMMVPCLATRPDNLFHNILGQELQSADYQNQSDSDENIKAYNAHISNPEWLIKYVGKYVAFVDGKLVGEDDDRSSLIKSMREQYPETRILFTQVRRDKEVVQILTPQFFTK